MKTYIYNGISKLPEKAVWNKSGKKYFFISQPFTESVKQRAVYMIIYRKMNEETYSGFSSQKVFMI